MGSFSETNFLFLTLRCVWTINMIWFLCGFSACEMWRLAILEWPSTPHQVHLLLLWQDVLVLLLSLQMRLCKWIVQGFTLFFPWRAYHDAWLASTQVAAVHPLCLVHSTTGMGTDSLFPHRCNLLCVWRWIPHKGILDQCCGDNILHKFGALRLSERQLSKQFLPLLINFPLSAPSSLMACTTKCQRWHRAHLFLAYMRTTGNDSV